MDTKAVATSPHATEQVNYFTSRFGWELPNVCGRQLFQAVLTTLFQIKPLLGAHIQQGYDHDIFQLYFFQFLHLPVS